MLKPVSHIFARRQGTDAGDAGRFLDADGVQASPRTGRQTALGEALDIPTARSCLFAPSGC